MEQQQTAFTQPDEEGIWDYRHIHDRDLFLVLNDQQYMTFDLDFEMFLAKNVITKEVHFADSRDQ